MRRLVFVLLAAGGLALPARADDLSPKPLPSLALDPQPPVSIWHGFYVGSDIFGVSRKGSRGFVGGDVAAGYDHAFANNVIVGIEGTTGVAPSLLGFGPLRGYDFLTTSAKVGYVMGRWTPYVTTDLVLAKPTSGVPGAFSGMDSANALFGSPEKLEAGGRVGAGFDYALSSSTSVSLGVSVGKGAYSVFP